MLGWLLGFVLFPCLGFSGAPHINIHQPSLDANPVRVLPLRVPCYVVGPKKGDPNPQARVSDRGNPYTLNPKP